LVLQHADTAFDAETICSLLCSSKAIRKAAQQAGGPCSSIALQGDADKPDTVSCVASFARWLPAHGHLVGDIDVYMKTGYINLDSSCNVVDTLLVFGLQQASSGISGSMFSTMAAALRQQQQQQPPFALRSFSSSVRHSAALLAALPAAYLTHLQLDTCSEMATSWELGGISRLTRLKCLALEGRILSEWLPALTPLTQLTSLDIAALDAYSEYSQDLPASLVRLQLPHVIVYSIIDQSPAAQEDRLVFSHLTQLTRLQITIIDAEAGNISVKLPPQLLELDAGCDSQGVIPLLEVAGPGLVPGLGVTALQQLQCLRLPSCKEQHTDLVKLTLLPAPTSVEVTSTFVDAREMAAAWAQLPQLRSLHLSATSEDDVPEDGLQELLVTTGTARSLQRLTLAFGCEISVPLGVFSGLTGLQQLRELLVSATSLNDISAVLGIALGGDLDALHLTKLTQLTLLAIDTWPVGSVIAAALACNLTQLRWLELVECELLDAAALPAIGKLTKLQHLNLSGNKFDRDYLDDCLQFLTDLRALTQLQLSSTGDYEPSEEALDEFWSAICGDLAV
jgi:Leucine-rich repeat (LRR) protein